MHKRTASGIVHILCLAWFIHGLSNAAHAVESAKEQDIKAAYLFNLGSYTQWPEKAFADAETPFRLCVLGTTAVTSVLDLVAQTRKINNRQTQVVRLTADLQGVEACHLVFIAQDAKTWVSHLLERVKQYPVLTVSEIERFIQAGGMIEFYMLNNHVRLAIAPQSIADVALKPSSQLMRVAQLRSR